MIKQPKTYYPHVESSPSFPEMEEKVLDFWKKHDVFQTSIENRPAEETSGENNEYIFYDGPPFANGLPHYGHLLTGCVKDIVARYQTMLGKRVERRFGWDCHGLPAEMEAEKELEISGRTNIEAFGIDKFNEFCRTSVMKYTQEWEYYVTRAARWVDFENDYKTMDRSYMESVIWAFKQLYEKGLVYESHRVMPYSWACETPLSNFETRMDNAYREKEDKAITVMFDLKEKPAGAPEGCNRYRILAWTTTPWTLPSNLALAVSEAMDYAFVEKDGDCLILANFAIPHHSKELGVDEGGFSGATVKGSALAGLAYEPLFPYFADQPNAFHIVTAAFVEEGDGTGVVHLAPGFGEDDQAVCAEHDIAMVCPVDNSGKFTSEVSDYVGEHVFDTVVPIIKRLKEEDKWLKTEQYIHNYPHCWRTDTPLIYKAVPSWYVEVTQFKDRMVELNQNINWIPGHIKDGLFGKWLENARDWSISRNRFWGTPIPVWRSDDPNYPRIDVYGSIEELEKDFGVKVEDLHKPFIDTLTRPNPDDPSGKSKMVRVSDVFDCWFESGSMPFAQVHYPFENKAWFENHFPADFIVEYTAQTRGWFYTLMVLATALFDSHPFKNCICHGVILDGEGKKLSKRLRNYVDPKDIFTTYGADALRWMMVAGPVMHGGELLIHKDGSDIRDIVRLSLKPIWNSYHFFTLYANSDEVQAEFQTDASHVMDRYILAKVKQAVSTVQSSMDAYDIPLACKAVEAFFEVLNNWYIRRSRQRFWKHEKDADKQAAYDTLFTVLTIMSRAAAPLLPLMAEEIYTGLHAGGEFSPEHSVHLTNFPDVSDIADEDALVKDMDRVRDICNAALSVRNTENIRIRQPLQSLTVYGAGVSALEAYGEVIKDELNIKEIQFSEQLEEVASFKLQINFPVLGKRLGPKMKEIVAATKQGEWQTTENGTIKVIGEQLEPEEFTLLLEPKHAEGTQALSTNDALVSLDLEITDALKAEGVARDVVRLVQQARKEAALDISDRIELAIEGSDDVNKAMQDYKQYIEEQTLAILHIGAVENMAHVSQQELEGNMCVIGFSVAA